MPQVDAASASRSRRSPPRRPIRPARRASARSRRCSPMPAECCRARRCSAPSPHLEQADRQALHQLRVRLGPLDVFLPAAAQARRAAVARGAARRPHRVSRCRRCPPPGAATLGAEADPRGAALAYRRLGREWLRIDLADRLASHARKVRVGRRRGPGRRRACATSVGLERGRHRPADGRNRLHQGRRCLALARPPPAARRTAARTPSHAFAELAKLKRK